MRRMIKQWAGDQRGASAVEFALLAPIMLLLYFGVVVFCQAYMAQKRVSHVASAVGDLVAQTSQISRAEAGELFSIGGLIMKPFSAATLDQRVTSITRQTATRYEVDWSRSTGDALPPLDQGSAVGVPSVAVAVGGSVIMSESESVYTSPMDPILNDIRNLIGSDGAGLGVLTFTRKAYLHPRNGAVPCPDC